MVGTIVGTYRLEELLGDGGLGGVYRAVDSASGKEAALRVFAREVSDDATLPDGLRLHVSDPVEADRWLAARQEDLSYVTKLPAGTPDFDRDPEARPISTLQAVIELAQEMLNRAPGSRVGREFAGRETDMVMELPGLFRGARCYSMVPGKLDATLDLLEALFAEA